MFVKDNNLTSVKEYFMKELKELYDEREGSTLFKRVVEFHLNWSSTDWILHKNYKLSESELLKFHFNLKELVKGKPLQYVLGEAYFYDLKFAVNSSVLIPRPETEELVHLILNDLDSKQGLSNLSIADIGTGSGCIPLALKATLSNAHILAVDVSEKALDTAKENGDLLDLDVQWKLMDVLDEKQWDCIDELDVLVSNPPYIPLRDQKEMHENVLNHEPHLALFVENDDPLLFYRKIGELGKTKIKKNGRLYFEVHESYAQETKTCLEKLGYVCVEVINDLQGKERIIRARIAQ